MNEEYNVTDNNSLDEELGTDSIIESVSEDVSTDNGSNITVVINNPTATKPVNDVEVASKVSIQLLNTDPDVSPRERIVKSSEKKGLYAALDIAEIWLSRALAN